MPLRLAQAPSAVHASASAIGCSQSWPCFGHLLPRTVIAFTLLFFGFVTQQIFDLALPHVLRASHFATDFRQARGRLPAVTADLSTSLAHLTYFLCEFAPAQSQADATTAR